MKKFLNEDLIRIIISTLLFIIALFLPTPIKTIVLVVSYVFISHEIYMEAFEGLKEKALAFGAHAVEIDGNDFDSIRNGFKDRVKGKPTVIVAHTVKGKGVSYMENNAGWHGKAPNKEEYELAMKELNNGTGN